MIWSWDVNEDTCAICNISITDSCPRVSTVLNTLVRYVQEFSFFESGIPIRDSMLIRDTLFLNSGFFIEIFLVSG